jgi:hypothetical protein
MNTTLKGKIRPDAMSREIQKRGGRDYTRELVRQRDKRTCQMCHRVWKKGERRFDVHHIYECGSKSMAYDSVVDIDNMITYCHRCHMNVDIVIRKMRERTGNFKHSLQKDKHPLYKGKEF